MLYKNFSTITPKYMCSMYLGCIHLKNYIDVQWVAIH